MSRATKGYQFTIQGNTVTAVYEVENGRVEYERMDPDEVWTFDGRNVIQVEMDDGRRETTTYSDPDGDGVFVKSARTGSTSGHDEHDDGDDHDDFSGAGSAPGGGRDDDGPRAADPDDDLAGGGFLRPDATGFHGTAYTFDFDSLGGLTGAYEISTGRREADYPDGNETWTSAGAGVIKTEVLAGRMGGCLFTDGDRDGVFHKHFELEVLTGSDPRSLETYQFALAGGAPGVSGTAVSPGDRVAGMMELGRRGWKTEALEPDEALSVVAVDGDLLILKIQAQRHGSVEFAVFRDDDGDGLWTEIAEGESQGLFLTADGQVDLVGIAGAGLLQAAEALIA